MCGRDELIREARERDREALTRHARSSARRLTPEELERIRNRHELDGVGRHVSIEAEDRGRLLEHVAVLEAQCGVTQFELSVEKWMSSTYKLQLETIESAAWFRLGRRLLGFRSIGPLPPFPPKA